MKTKRLLSAIAAGVLACAMSFNVMAADSPSTGGVVQEVTNAKDADNKSVEIIVEKLTSDGQAAAEEVKKTETLKSVLADQYVEGMQVLDVQEVSVVGDKTLVKFPVTITFTVPGVVSTTKVAVLHYNKQGVWEVVPSQAGEGTITATFNDLSPVAFIVDKNTSSSTTGTGNGSATSPKTGESFAVIGLGVIALLAAGGAYGLSRKKRA